MITSYDKNTAVVVLPAVGNGRLSEPSLRSWLAQSHLVRVGRSADSLAGILAEIGRPCPGSGIAALRMWGQTGDRPTGWIAAADPVYLEPRLDRLCLHALGTRDVQASDLTPLVDHLQSTLGEDSGYGFASIGSHAYVSSQQPIASAIMPADDIDQCSPDEYLPTDADVVGHRKLLSEIEMALHEHEVNLARQDQGRQPVNSLWIWGGGFAPEQHTEPHPPLYSDDPLLAGYWQSKTGIAERWPGSIDACIEAAVAGFVASVPDDDEMLEPGLRQLRDALRSKRLSTLILLFRDGLRAEVHRSDALRVWRRRNTLLETERAGKT